MSHSSACSTRPCHRYVLAIGPTTCAQAASLASTVDLAIFSASSRESVVVWTCRCSPPPHRLISPACPPKPTAARPPLPAAADRATWSAGTDVTSRRRPPCAWNDERGKNRPWTLTSSLSEPARPAAQPCGDSHSVESTQSVSTNSSPDTPKAQGTESPGSSARPITSIRRTSRWSDLPGSNGDHSRRQPAPAFSLVPAPS
jgi:hypothetical protein